MKRAMLFTLFIGFIFPANSQKLLRKISQGSDVTAVIFLAVNCPISQKYIPTLNAIHERYGSQAVNIQAVFPGKIKKRDLAKFREEYGIRFTTSPDRRYQLVKILSATTTPEVMVMDRQLAIKYRGAIDNWFFELGGYRQEATEDYLINAIEALLAGEEPKITNTKALGCFIQIPGKSR